MNITLPLDLSRHCIQTEIKRQYNRAISQYLGNGEKIPDRSRLEGIIELTRHALEVLDFGRLRSDHRELAGGGRAVVWVVMRDGQLEIRIDGKVVYKTPGRLLST